MTAPFVRRLTLLSALHVAVAGCTADSSLDTNATTAAGRAQGEVTVFAAASTSNALDEAVAAFAADTQDRIHISYAASSTLAQQISKGAVVDLYLSASTEWADFVENQVAVTDRRDILGNQMVVVVPADSTLQIQVAEDLLREQVGYLALADPDSVPAGRYARHALQQLGIWNQLQSRVVAAKDVRQALVYVETGAAEAGMVYATDAAASERVKVAFECSPQITGAICYPVLLMKHGAHNYELAGQLFDFLGSPRAANIFERHGFVVLKGDAASSRPSPEAVGREQNL